MVRQIIIVAAASAALASAAHGQGRPDARALTCGQVQSLIAQSGAVVMTTGQHTFDRFVTGNRFCAHPEAAMRTSIQTRDAARCSVYHCQYVDREDWLWRRW